VMSRSIPHRWRFGTEATITALRCGRGGDASVAVRTGPKETRGLLRELPPGKSREVSYVEDALAAAGERYDRHTARKDEWWRYARRKDRLETLTKYAEWTASGLCGLDIITREDLQNRLGTKELEALAGSLRVLAVQTAEIVREVQATGKPRDIAEERWILELADIYENFFCREATVSGAGDEPTNRRGKFYHLLQLSRPLSFPRHGKLSVRHIKRVLAQRRRQLLRRRGIEEFGY
jgi:hypothetical protein